MDALEARLRADLGFDPDGAVAGAEARERTAALALVLEIAGEVRRQRSPRSRGGTPRRARGAGGRRSGGLRRRREPADAPPGEGARVGRGLPPRAGGGDAADPAGGRRRRGARGGAAAALRRPDARPPPPHALVGRAAGRVRAIANRGGARAASCAHSRQAAVRATAADASVGSRGPYARVTILPGARSSRRPDAPPTSRSWPICARGDRRAPARTTCPPMSSPMTRCWPRSWRSGRASPADAAAGQGHGPDEARALRRGDPRDRGAPLSAASPVADVVAGPILRP